MLASEADPGVSTGGGAAELWTGVDQHFVWHNCRQRKLITDREQITDFSIFSSNFPFIKYLASLHYKNCKHMHLNLFKEVIHFLCSLFKKILIEKSCDFCTCVKEGVGVGEIIHCIQ